jgi:lipoteichoic acid synthase
MYSEIINLFGVVFDISILMIVFLLITGGRFKITMAIIQVITLLWSFVNVMYGKFFFQYMSLSAFGEAHGLGDGLVVNSILSAFYWYDLFYVFSFIFFIVAYNKKESFIIGKECVLRFFLIPIGSIILTFVAYSAYHFIHPHYRNNWDLYMFRAKEFLYDSVRGGTPNLAHFQTGCVRVVLFELYDMLHVMELSEEQKKQIETYYSDYSLRTTNHLRNPDIKNVIFILLESFLSNSIDLKVDNKEVTPFLNSLKRNPNVYYNGNMVSDIGCGESSDGQFIYMTGILPLRYRMTVGQVKDNVLPSLPKLLKSELGINYSEIISPTVPNLWQQSEMNVAYGFDNAYWLEDIIKGESKTIDDQLIFQFSSRHLDEIKEPFFSLILSLSTHSPYNKHAGDDFFKSNHSLNESYKNYLNSCHFLDSQLKSYFESLKEIGFYDNSLIVMASDHYAHLDMLGMSDQISSHTPLFIINGNVDVNSTWKGEFHQLDLYTTLLDLLAVENQWRGLGNTLLNPSYTNSVSVKTSEISDMIINGDFFAQ